MNVEKVSEYPKNFTKDQKLALSFLEEFMNNPSKHIATLYGAAGTGKTYVLKYFIDNICKVSVCPTAPTHKAVRVIEQMVNRKAKTFHSLHGLRPNVELANFDIANPQFDALAEPKIKDYKLIIVDECSQINSSLQRLNEQRAKMYNCKILYVGDSLQLPPVKENISGVFLIDDKIELHNIVRQEKGNPILELAGLLRYDILNNTNNGISYLLKNPVSINSKNCGYSILNTTQFAKKVIEEFKLSNGNPDYARYLAWTNSSINSWNQYVRSNVMGYNSIEIIGMNDILTGYNTVLDEFSDPIIINSEDYIVDNVVRRITDDGFEVFVTRLRSYTDLKLFTNVLIVNHNSNLFKNFVNKLNEYHKSALYAKYNTRKQLWREYYNYKNKYLLLTDIELPISGFVKKDLYYGYGFTIHKSQGSTYNKVFVNLLNIAFFNGNKNYPINNSKYMPTAGDLKNRLLYVALTRASDKVYFLYE